MSRRPVTRPRQAMSARELDRVQRKFNAMCVAIARAMDALLRVRDLVDETDRMLKRSERR